MKNAWKEITKSIITDILFFGATLIAGRFFIPISSTDFFYLQKTNNYIIYSIIYVAGIVVVCTRQIIKAINKVGRQYKEK